MMLLSDSAKCIINIKYTLLTCTSCYYIPNILHSSTLSWLLAQQCAAWQLYEGLGRYIIQHTAVTGDQALSHVSPLSVCTECSLQSYSMCGHRRGPVAFLIPCCFLALSNLRIYRFIFFLIFWPYSSIVRRTIKAEVPLKLKRQGRSVFCWLFIKLIALCL